MPALLRDAAIVLLIILATRRDVWTLWRQHQRRRHAAREIEQLEALYRMPAAEHRAYQHDED